MHLRHAPIGVKKDALHVDLAVQIVEIAPPFAAVAGSDLIARAIKTQGAAKRQMQVKRQLTAHAARLASRDPGPVIVNAERFAEAIRGRIRGVARTVTIESANQVRVKFKRQVLHANIP